MIRIALISLLLIACQPPQKSGDVSRLGMKPFAIVSSFDLDEVTISELQKRMTDGSETAVSITQKYIARIEEIDTQGPTLRSVLQINPDALEIAQLLDDERSEGKIRGPLHGIPVLLKGNIDTDDQLYTNAGSLALEKNIASDDAFLVSKLRDAGAIILGKTNLSEWANFRSTRSSSGWSSVGGQCKNPYYLDRNPCGSSSGSAVAVSANLAPLTIGTETDGSIVCPSGINGIVGIKPTTGLISRDGIIPISESQDTGGPMARTVTDAVLALGTMTGIDDADARTALSAGKFKTDYRPHLKKDGLKGKRIGWAKAYSRNHPLVKPLMEKAIKDLEAAGATIVILEDWRVDRAASEKEWTLLKYEFRRDLNQYLKSLADTTSVKSLADIIAYNRKHADRVMPFFKQQIFLQSQEIVLGDAEYQKLKSDVRRLAGQDGIDKIMKKHNLDAIVTATNNPSWPIDLINRDGSSGGTSGPAAMAGYPNITVPMGFASGLPVGISFFGRAWSEGTLIEVAYAYEQATRHRRKPEFKASHPYEKRSAGTGKLVSAVLQ